MQTYTLVLEERMKHSVKYKCDEFTLYVPHELSTTGSINVLFSEEDNGGWILKLVKKAKSKGCDSYQIDSMDWKGIYLPQSLRSYGQIYMKIEKET